MIQLRRLEIICDVEILQSLNPLLLVLQQMDSNGVWPKLMCASGGWLWEIVHGPFCIVPVLCSMPFSQPIPEHLVLWSFQMLLWYLRLSDPLHYVPRYQIPHAGHVVHERVHARAWNHIPVIQIFSWQRLQRIHQALQPEVNVVVSFQHVVVWRVWLLPIVVDQHLRQAGEVSVGLALVHVLFAVEDDDVVVAHDLQSHQDLLVFFRQVAEDELDVHFPTHRRLRAVDHTEEMAAVVLVWEGQNAHEYANVARGRILIVGERSV